MPNSWDDGNAARDLSYTDTAYNPYAPLNYAERLKNAGKKPPSAPAHVEYTHGQLYGGSWMMPSKPIEPAQPVAPQPGQPYMSTPISFEPLTPSVPLTADPLPPAPAPLTPPPAYLQHRHRSVRAAGRCVCLSAAGAGRSALFGRSVPASAYGLYAHRQPGRDSQPTL